MTRRRGLCAILLLVPAIAGTQADYLSARRKFRQIGNQQVRPGSTVTLTEEELNAYFQTEAREVEGVREPRVQLAKERVEAFLLVDFAKLKSAHGEKPGWLLSQMLSGERPVYLRTRLVSSGGKATVYLERVEINGLGVEGRTLDFLVRNYVQPHYPEARIGEPFELDYRIDRIDVKSGGVGVVIGGGVNSARR